MDQNKGKNQSRSKSPITQVLSVSTRFFHLYEYQYLKKISSGPAIDFVAHLYILYLSEGAIV